MNPKEIGANQLEMVHQLTVNGIGSTEDKKNREKAQNCLNIAKCQESEKVEKGWRWMRKEKTSKLVHPDKFEEMKGEGYVFCITKK